MKPREWHPSFGGGPAYLGMRVCYAILCSPQLIHLRNTSQNGECNKQVRAVWKTNPSLHKALFPHRPGLSYQAQQLHLGPSLPQMQHWAGSAQPKGPQELQQFCRKYVEYCIIRSLHDI